MRGNGRHAVREALTAVFFAEKSDCHFQTAKNSPPPPADGANQVPKTIFSKTRFHAKIIRNAS